jgi:hypothetical protein
VSPSHPGDLPAEVFFLTYEKKRPLRSLISNLLGTEDVSLGALGTGVFDLAALASMLVRILGSGGGGRVGGGMGGGVQVLEGGSNSNSNGSGSEFTHSQMKEGIPTRPQFYLK